MLHSRLQHRRDRADDDRAQFLNRVTESLHAGASHRQVLAPTAGEARARALALPARNEGARRPAGALRPPRPGPARRRRARGAGMPARAARSGHPRVDRIGDDQPSARPARRRRSRSLPRPRAALQFRGLQGRKPGEMPLLESRSSRTGIRVEHRLASTRPLITARAVGPPAERVSGSRHRRCTPSQSDVGVSTTSPVLRTRAEPLPESVRSIDIGRIPIVYLITPQAKRNLSSRSGIGGVLRAT